MLGKEFDIVAAIVESVAYAVFEEILGKIHVLVDVDKRHFRLDHPELCQMSGCVGVLGTESGTERIDGSKRCCAKLTLELTAHGKRGRLAEEIARVVNRALFGAWKLVEWQCGHLEHSASSLAVARRDKRGVEVIEPALLEIAVYGEGESGTHAQHSREGVGAGTEVRDLTQELQRVSLFLEGIALGIGGAVKLHFAGLNLDGLPFALALHKQTVDTDCRTGGERLELLVGEGVHVEHDLDVAYRRTVVERHELHIFVTAVGTHPSFDTHLLAEKLGGVCEKV